VNNPRSATVQEIAESANPSGTTVNEAIDFADAIRRALELTGQNGVLVITGSIYLVGEALQWLSTQSHVRW
jgi:dihydrofolate synthase/folylpolyglutamate synthase